MIIKPVMDSLGLFTLSTINFLCGCTVFAMASLMSSLLSSKEGQIELKSSTLLAFGGSLGGLSGKYFFEIFKNLFINPSIASAIQSLILLTINLLSFIYTLNKEKIKTLNITSTIAIVAIGGGLGFLSSFLGIGGGPINIIFLQFFFSMPIKQAAQNSLYVIFFSQITSLISTLIGKSISNISLPVLFAMMACGIAGAIAGKIINKKIDENVVFKLFMVTMVLLVLLNIYNFITFVS